MGGVTITELIDKMGLRNMTPELETDNVYHDHMNPLQLLLSASHILNYLVQFRLP